MSARLVLPDVRYKDSYLAGLREYHEEGRFLDEKIEKLENDFGSYVQKQLKKAKGENLPEGYVPETRLWLIDGEECVGDLGIRHTLTDHLLKIGGHIGYSIRPSKRKRGYGKLILELGLLRAKEMGFDRVLLTCDVTNVGSRKIIEANGGVFENQIPVDGAPDKARFWIDTNK